MRIVDGELFEGTPDDTSDRERRLAEIQRRIASGTYLIDLSLLAERILDGELLDLD